MARRTESLIQTGSIWADSGDKANPPFSIESGWDLAYQQTIRPQRTTFNFAFNQVYSLSADVNEIGATLTWDATITYQQNAYVTGTDGQIYRSEVASNLNNDPVIDGGVNWKLLSDVVDLAPDKFAELFKTQILLIFPIGSISTVPFFDGDGATWNKVDPGSTGAMVVVSSANSGELNAPDNAFTGNLGTADPMTLLNLIEHDHEVPSNDLPGGGQFKLQDDSDREVPNNGVKTFKTGEAAPDGIGLEQTRKFGLALWQRTA